MRESRMWCKARNDGEEPAPQAIAVDHGVEGQEEGAQGVGDGLEGAQREGVPE